MNSSISAATSDVDRDDTDNMDGDADDNVHGTRPLALLCTLRRLEAFDIALDATAEVAPTLADRRRVDETAYSVHYVVKMSRAAMSSGEMLKSTSAFSAMYSSWVDLGRGKVSRCKQ